MQVSMEEYISCNVEVKINEYFNEASLINDEIENYIIELEKLAIQKISEIVRNICPYITFKLKKLIPTKQDLVSIFLLKCNVSKAKTLLLDY